MNFETLVLSGGALSTAKILGALQFYYDKGYLQTIKKFCGNSAGSIICYLLCIGCTPLEMITYFCVGNIISHFHDINIKSIMSPHGILSFDKFQKEIEMITIQKIGQFITLQQMKELFDYELNISTYNYTKKRFEILNYKTNPTMPCLVGLRMSCAVPFIFEMYQYNYCFYLDGGVYDNFAVSIFCEKTERILGIYLDYLDDEEHFTEYPSNMSEYASNLLSIMSSRFRPQDLKEYNVSLVKIKATSQSFGNVFMNVRDLLDLFSNGYSQAESQYS